MMASLAEGGSASSIANGVTFFHKLKTAGNYVPVQATGATIKAGTTPVVFNWDYLNTAAVVGACRTGRCSSRRTPSWAASTTQAINKNAPHPAAARLWEEFLYSQAADGGQNLWLAGGARPVEQSAMTSNGSIDKTAAGEAAAGVRHAGVPDRRPRPRTPLTTWRRTGPRPSASEGRWPQPRRPRPAPGPRGPGAGCGFPPGSAPCRSSPTSGVFLLLPTGIVIVERVPEPERRAGLVQPQAARQLGDAQLLHRLVRAVR